MTTLAITLVPLVAGTTIAVGASTTLAKGYVAPPYWAAYTRDGIAVLTYEKVPSADLGKAGGPKGTQTEVPVGVHLISRDGKSLRSLITVPKGDGILAAAGSEDGVVVTAGPLKDLVDAGAPAGAKWQVIVSDLKGAAKVAYRYTPGARQEAPPALAATAAYWAAITTSARVHGTVDRSVLLEGRFSGAARAATYTVDTAVLPTAVAVEPTGHVGLFDLEYAAHGASVPRFPKAAHVVLVWPNPGLLVAAPGGFLAVDGSAVSRPEGGGRSVPFGQLPKGSGVVSVAGDGEGMVLLVQSHKGKLSTWVIGSAPKSLHAVVASAPSALFMTTAGLVGVTIHATAHGVSVGYAAAAGS